MNAVVAIDAPISHKSVAADIPIERIHVKRGFNPRIFFPAKHIEDLATSIRLRGIVQSVAVWERDDLPGHYWVIAGECRLRAARIVGLALIPSRIFDVSEDEAHDIASAENGPRENLSPGEEALEARRMMMRKGNREEAALHLCWSPEKLDARLLLTQATESVLVALAEQRIRLGHAELLSPLPAATQEGTLEQVLKRGITVEELRSKLAAFSLDLGTACFDKTACQACPHNTTRQASLFDQNIGEGRCTNRPCFHEKTIKHLEDLRPALRDRYSSVFLDTERGPGTWAVLLKRDVGNSQFEVGCAQCANFGCVLSSKPGEAGRVTEDVCFDLACREQKMAAHRATAGEPDSAQTDSAKATRPIPAERSVPATSRPSGKPKRPTCPEAPRAVQERIQAVQRRAAAAEVQTNRKMTQVYAALALLSELNLLYMEATQDDPLAKRGIKRRSTAQARVGLLEALYALDEPSLEAIIAELAARVAGREDSTNPNVSSYLPATRATLRLLHVDLARHFVLDADFLRVHTKAAIEGLLREAHFDQHCNRVDQNAFKKLFARKHEEIVSAVTSSGFDFRGFVPQCLQVKNR